MATEPALSALTERNAVLAEIYRTGTVEGPDGESVAVHSRLTPPHAEALYQTILRKRPEQVIEVGMAFGASTLAILTALEQLGGDRMLTSIDPFQSTQWQGIGRLNVARAGLSARHTLIEELDYVALPALVSDGRHFDAAYIDGWHTFDYTLLDFFYVDLLLRPGGIVGFNDCDMPAVTKVLRYVQTHRHYETLDVGLEPQFAHPPSRLARSVWAVGRRLPLGPRPNPLQRSVGLRADDQYLRKLDDWQPPWDFFARF